MELRKATLKDENAIVALEAASFAEPWPLYAVHGEFTDNPCAHLFVAEEGNELLGYIDFMVTFDSATISRLAVRPESQRQGIATKLLEKMFVVAKQEGAEFVTLEVRVSNTPAIELYHRNEFEDIVMKKAYYTNGEDALYMVRHLV